MADIPFIDLETQRHRIEAEIMDGIARVVASGRYIMGPEVAELERRLADYTGASHAISCSSGTDALLLVLMAWGVGPGDGVVMPAFTFPATAEAAALLGATPVFVDVAAESFNMTADHAAEGVDLARRAGLEPKAVIAVDLFGQPADYPTIREAVPGVPILADAAQSFGGRIGDRLVGTLGDATATSFFPAKPLGCYGDGGAVFVNDDEVARLVESLRAHGKGDHKYEIEHVGINGRLDTLQAAILLTKLDIFPDEVERRQVVATRYSDALAEVVDVPQVSPGMTSVWAQYTIRTARREHLIDRLAARSIPTAVYYPRPMHHQPAYAHAVTPSGGLPVAEQLATEVLSLPMHPYLEPDTQDVIMSEIRSALAG